MKNIISVLVLIIMSLSACKKEKISTPYASINVVNASLGAGTIKVNYFGKPIIWSAYSGTIGNIGFATNQVFTISNLNGDYPFTIVQALDTLKSVFSQKLSVESSGIYTLFTAGQTGSFEAVYIKETSIPYNLPDSTIAVRVINLSPNSPLVNVTLASASTVNISSGLAYKQLTDFKHFPLLRLVPPGSITFEVRNATSNLVLTSYTIPTTPPPGTLYPTVSTSLSRFKSITLVIKGLAGITAGSNAFSIFPVAHY